MLTFYSFRFSGYHQTLSSFRRGGRQGDEVSFKEAINLEIGIIEQCEELFPNPEKRYLGCIWPWFTAEILEATIYDNASTFVGKPGWEHGATPRRCTAGMIRKHALVIRGLYYYHVKMWLDAAGKDKLLIIYADTYFRQPETELQDAVASITGVKNVDMTTETSDGNNYRNPATAGFRMDAKTARRLRQLYAPCKSRLKNLPISNSFY